MTNYKLYVTLGIFFLIRLVIGLVIGINDPLALSYFNLAIEDELNSSFQSSLFNLSPATLFIKPWLLIITIAVFLFQDNLIGTMLITTFTGTLSLYFFYRLLRVFHNEMNALFFTIFLGILPLHLNVSTNPIYDAFFLCLLFIFLEQFTLFIINNKFLNLLIAGISCSVMLLIHSSINMWYGLLWFLVPVLHRYTAKQMVKIIGIYIVVASLPILQMIIWKSTSGTFLPNIISLVSRVESTTLHLFFPLINSALLIGYFLYLYKQKVNNFPHNKIIIGLGVSTIVMIISFYLLPSLLVNANNYLYLQINVLLMISFILTDKHTMPVRSFQMVFISWLPTGVIMIADSLFKIQNREIIKLVSPIYW